jgi:hypothetical protein
MCFTPLWLPADIRDYSNFPASIGTRRCWLLSDGGTRALGDRD